MALRNFFNTEGISPSRFADELGVSVSTVYRWMRGESTPGREIARKIVIKTKGLVTMLDLRG